MVSRGGCAGRRVASAKLPSSSSPASLSHLQVTCATHRSAASRVFAFRSSLPRVEQSHRSSLAPTGSGQRTSRPAHIRAHSVRNHAGTSAPASLLLPAFTAQMAAAGHVWTRLAGATTAATHAMGLQMETPLRGQDRPSTSATQSCKAQPRTECTLEFATSCKTSLSLKKVFGIICASVPAIAAETKTRRASIFPRLELLGCLQQTPQIAILSNQPRHPVLSFFPTPSKARNRGRDQSSPRL